MLSDATFTEALLTALVIGVVAYIVGDLLILPRTNNAIATVADAVLVFAALWIAAESMDWTLSFGEMLSITALAGVFEYFFHIWLLRDHKPVRDQL